MCGDLEEEDTEAQRLYAGFLQAAHAAIHEAIEHQGGSRGVLGEKAGMRLTPSRMSCCIATWTAC